MRWKALFQKDEMVFIILYEISGCLLIQRDFYDYNTYVFFS